MFQITQWVMWRERNKMDILGAFNSPTVTEDLAVPDTPLSEPDFLEC